MRLRPLSSHEDMCFDRTCLKEIASFSTLTCVQQSVMNLGILMVQGLVNSFGTAVMAAFAAAVKIDSFAYMPVQEFGNAFSTFIAQNFGAGRYDRIHRGVRSAFVTAVVFSLLVSVLVFIFAKPLILIFVRPDETEIIAVGTRVVLSYWFASIPEIGVTGIWWSIPIGWLIADVVGIWCYRYVKGVRGS